MTNKVKPIPDGHHTATPYLILKDAARAIDFYKRAFGAKEVWMAVSVLAAACMLACAGSSDESVSATIVGMERAALDRWGKGDPGGYLDIYADDIAYFDPFQERRVDGIAAMRELVTPLAGKIKIARYEMVGTRVQHRGKLALLTYNLVNYDAAGTIINRWNSTEVFALDDGRWKIVHSHWSLTKPELKQPGANGQ